MGIINKDGIDLGMRFTQRTDDHRESTFLFQQLSVLIQRYNAAHCLGYLHPHNSPGRNVAVTAFVLVLALGIYMYTIKLHYIHEKKIHLTMLKFDFRTAANFMYKRTHKP